jgi:dinuclear metal center YbgI/SA1388 family protein
MNLSQLSRWMDELLLSDPVPDVALNGLQVGGAWDVTKVGLAVDARQGTFQAAAAAGCGLLLVHHGLYWGGVYPLVGADYRRLEVLVKRELGLYGAHLPLDIHPTLGNNAQLLQLLGIQPEGTFGNWRGVEVGRWGSLPESISPEALVDILEAQLGTTCLQARFGPDQVKRVGVVTGAMGTGDALAAVRAGLDLVITGEQSHPLHALAEDWGLGIIFAGHYATEELGVKAVGRKLQEDLGLETEFFPYPSHM